MFSITDDYPPSIVTTTWDAGIQTGVRVLEGDEAIAALVSLMRDMQGEIDELKRRVAHVRNDDY